MRRIILSVCLLAAAVGPCAAQSAAQPSAATAQPSLSRAEQERFLLEAKVVKARGAKVGITATQRATLSDGTITHDASIQTIDESAARFESAQRVEFNFRDYWGYNVAAYRLAVMLGLDMVPPSVAREFRAKRGSFTWWVDDVLMDEKQRVKTKKTPPDVVYWNKQNYVMRVFDELIANTDRNQGNIVIGRTWKMWLIDHSRAFRTNETLRDTPKLLHCERTMLARMKELTEASLKAELGDYLTIYEIQALLKRRDRIVERIEALGPAAQYDLNPPPS